MKKLGLILTVAISLLFFSGCGDEEATTLIEDNSSFEELKAEGNKTYSLVTTDGKKLDITVENDTLTTNSPELKGKNVLINFWATWCPPCKKEIPVFNTLYEKYPEKFVVVGVLYERNKDAQELKQFMDELKMKFPVTTSDDENFRMAKAFDNVTKIPESFLYDTKGKFVKKFVGEITEKELESLIIK